MSRGLRNYLNFPNYSVYRIYKSKHLKYNCFMSNLLVMMTLHYVEHQSTVQIHESNCLIEFFHAFDIWLFVYKKQKLTCNKGHRSYAYLYIIVIKTHTPRCVRLFPFIASIVDQLKKANNENWWIILRCQLQVVEHGLAF